jgi:hypothetical protein
LADRQKAVDAKAAEVEAKAKSLSQKERVWQAERIKLANERKASEKDLGSKLSKLSQYEKEDREFEVNYEAVLERRLGKDWYDKITSRKVTGGAPSAQELAYSMEKVKEEMRKEFEEREAKKTQTLESTQKEREEKMRADAETEAGEFLETAWKDYSAFEVGGIEKANVSKAIVQYIEQEARQKGRVVSMKEALDAIESAYIDNVNQTAQKREKLAAIEKYKAKLTPAEKAAQTIARSTESGSTKVGRTTLTNNLTASTPGRTQAKTDDERRERAVAAIAAVKASRQ